MPGQLSTEPTRLDRARLVLQEHHLDAMLVSRTAAKRWLSGFTLKRGEEETAGFSGTLLLTTDRMVLFADGRYLEQAQTEAIGWEVARTRQGIGPEVARWVEQLGVRRCGAEAGILTHAAWQAIAAAPNLELVPIDAALAELRIVKEPGEQEAIARACALTDRCFDHLLNTVRVGMNEAEVAWMIEDWFRANGAEGTAFDPLVLVGARAAMPHGHSTNVPVQVGSALLLDFGCQVDGYRSDMTRTVFVGEPADEQRRLYGVVARAQAAAFAATTVGAVGTDVDGAARGVIAEAGLGEAFTHGLGHGIGLETHEAPSLRLYPEALRAGMTFTLEPGVYLPGRIGIRIEDDVLLTEDGPRYLTRSSRDLIVL